MSTNSNILYELQTLITNAHEYNAFMDRLRTSMFAPYTSGLSNLISNMEGNIRLLNSVLADRGYTNFMGPIFNERQLKEIIPYNDKRQDAIRLAKQIFKNDTSLYECKYGHYNDEWSAELTQDHTSMERAVGSSKGEALDKLINQLRMRDVLK